MPTPPIVTFDEKPETGPELSASVEDSSRRPSFAPPEAAVLTTAGPALFDNVDSSTSTMPELGSTLMAEAKAPGSEARLPLIVDAWITTPDWAANAAPSPAVTM